MSVDDRNARRDGTPEGVPTTVSGVGAPGGVSFFQPVAATVGGIIFGEYAHKLAQWLVCAHSVWAKNQCCSLEAKVEAINIGTLVSTIVVIVGANAAASRVKDDSFSADLSVVGALTGALLAVLDAASHGADFPVPERLPAPLYFYVIFVLLFAIPRLCMPKVPRDFAPVIASRSRLAAALLVGAFLGLTAQLGAELYWKGLAFGEYGSQKFVVAPLGTAIAVGAWSVALFDPYLRPSVWVDQRARRRLWLSIYGAGAVVLAGGYGVLFDAPSSGVSAATAALVVAALALPGTGAIALVLAFCRGAAVGRTVVTAATLLGSVMAAAVASGLALAGVHSRIPSEGDVLPFVVAQMLGSAAMVLTVFGTHRIMSGRPDLRGGPTQNARERHSSAE